ncbi:nucleoside kinase [Candidatus Bipolaricaulota bacterium]|nr:nucleoside kinase [Candidatus Bipolaricaulota bacterium]
MTKEQQPIRLACARTTVQVHLPDDRVFEGKRGTPLVKFFQVAFTDSDNPPVAAVVQGELCELFRPVERDITAKPVFLSDSDGMRIYCRSLSFLLIVSVHDLFPDARLIIDYSVPHGGYFCRVEEREPFTDEELSRIKARMQEIVAADRPIERRRLSVAEVKEVFAARGDEGKARLLTGFSEDHINFYSLDGFLDYFYGYMVPSTGLLRTFALEPFSDGFVLRFPRRESPTTLLPAPKFTALCEVFSEYGKWLDVVGVRDVSALNEAIRSQRIEEVILVSEALHEQRIAGIASALAGRHDKDHRLVFIAGPSSSGKTTFSKRLAVQLLANGIHPYPLAMDHYFLPRELLRKEGEEIDFDSFAALDAPFLEGQLADLLQGKKVSLPQYNFRTGKREVGPTVQLKPDQILIVEGIHGLNPQLMKNFHQGTSFRIFVSALTQLNLDSHNRVPTTDTRLIRRIVRDVVYRGYDAQSTIMMWENVRAGEKQNIFPYQEQADVMFNSALVYELAVLKPLAEPLLLQVRQEQPRIEAERLLAFLKWFEPYHGETIPGNSLLREFFGGLTLRD